MPFLTDNFANAASTHPFGVSASEAVKQARQQLADLLTCETHELVFTSGATEAINLAIKGVADGGGITIRGRAAVVDVGIEQRAGRHRLGQLHGYVAGGAAGAHGFFTVYHHRVEGKRGV